ncbi:serine/threonine-protein phosphatase [Paenibacillus sp. MZ04-78.2]|uniref:PP2C family protein-serine/threonine phosphatase n=1 Tax=Paenibacillus sp. MZ04-78.2 TaxID=2962034 RepID=UPI0020B821BE|nr:PP2C family serine/threonine-protein phosphatase [Paenibacillus sp. MZ04-78.2]MCP3775684.1 serine/threonine-protein phosphatase [Paenibacillus sp. MZ04-78.2]
MKPTIAVHFQYGSATHTGWFRTINEDRSLLRVGQTVKGVPYAAAALADGMGGSEDGAQASELAIRRLKEWLDAKVPALLTAGDSLASLEREAEAWFFAVHRELVEAGRGSGGRLGTTLTLLLLTDAVYFIAHVGDCRIYRLTPAGRCKRLTRDHTWVSAQVRRGRMSVRRARSHPKRNVLLHSLGMGERPDVYIRSGCYAPGTLFLLSSDGFHDRFLPRSIAALLRTANGKGSDLQEMCDLLLTKALQRKSDDNISVVLLKPVTGRKNAKERLRLHCGLWLRRLYRCGRKLLSSLSSG